eukprot:Skav227818  [mRNA]  locus=scaffold948:253184:258582:- [translate_table: standard]
MKSMPFRFLTCTTPRSQQRNHGLTILLVDNWCLFSNSRHLIVVLFHPAVNRQTALAVFQAWRCPSFQQLLDHTHVTQVSRQMQRRARSPVLSQVHQPWRCSSQQGHTACGARQGRAMQGRGSRSISGLWIGSSVQESLHGFGVSAEGCDMQR